MDTTLQTALIVAAVAGIVLLVLRSGLFRRKPCRWAKAGFRAPDARLDRWVCARCRVEAFSADGHPPKECKRAVRPTGL